MVHDRGTIKWASLMLPEHVQLLRKIWIEDKKIEKPSLDEQELEILNQRLREAYHQKEHIQISYYENHQLLEVQGVIKKLDPFTQTVVLKEETAITHSIPFHHIYDVK